jgi:hypothetical protein
MNQAQNNNNESPLDDALAALNNDAADDDDFQFDSFTIDQVNQDAPVNFNNN